MSSLTTSKAVETFGVAVDNEVFTEDADIPVYSGLPQAQGDIVVLHRPNQSAETPVPQSGVAVVRGEAGGNTHHLLAFGEVYFDGREASAQNPSLGTLSVPEGSTAYLAHYEHGYMGIGSGNYEIRRQVQYADEVELVRD